MKANLIEMLKAQGSCHRHVHLHGLHGHHEHLHAHRHAHCRHGHRDRRDLHGRHGHHGHVHVRLPFPVWFLSTNDPFLFLSKR